jgi:hypothetical protein
MHAAGLRSGRVLGWTTLLLASVAIHVADSVDVSREAEQALLRSLDASLTEALSKEVLFDTHRGCNTPALCAAEVMARTGAKEAVFVFIYGGLTRTQFIVRRARPAGVLASEELILANSDPTTPDWSGLAHRLFWDWMKASPVEERAGVLGPLSLISAASAALATSAGLRLWAGDLSGGSAGLVGAELAAQREGYRTVDTASAVLLGVGLGLLLSGGLWALLDLSAGSESGLN